MTELRCTTEDGIELVGDLVRPEGDPIGGLVVCHPHPSYGGDRHHPVVTAIWSAAAIAGFVAYRFDFRPGFAGGVGEQLDVIAALDAVAGLTTRPLAVAGYSFGAAVACSTVDPRITAIVAVAPPLAMMEVAAPDAPALVLTPRHDQFSPPDTVEPVVDGWPEATFEVIESADHFLLGRADQVGERAAAWLAARGR